MEPKFQSSFIPKGPLATTGTATRTSFQSDRSILGTLAVLVFVLGVLGAIGIYGYERYLISNIAKMGNSLTEAKNSLEPEVIQKISALDGRINSTRELLDRHIVLSPLFAFLEEATLKTVRFTKFEYTTNEKGLTLSLRGQARGYTAVALQSQIFNASPYMKDIVFSDLSLDDKGNVIFSLKTTLDPAIISFKGNAGGDTVVPVSNPADSVSPVPVTEPSQTPPPR